MLFLSWDSKKKEFRRLGLTNWVFAMTCSVVWVQVSVIGLDRLGQSCVQFEHADHCLAQDMKMVLSFLIVH